MHFWAVTWTRFAVGVARDMVMSLHMFSGDVRGWSLEGLDGSTSRKVVYFHNNMDGHISVLYQGVTATDICLTFLVLTKKSGVWKVGSHKSVSLAFV